MFIRFSGESQPSHAFNCSASVFSSTIHSSPILPAYIFIVSARVCVRLVCVCLVYLCLTNIPIQLFQALWTFFPTAYFSFFQKRHYSAWSRCFQIFTQSAFYHVDATSFLQAQSRKCRARYRDVAKTTCGIRQSNYLPLLLYRIPLKCPYKTSDFLSVCLTENHAKSKKM